MPDAKRAESKPQIEQTQEDRPLTIKTEATAEEIEKTIERTAVELQEVSVHSKDNGEDIQHVENEQSAKKAGSVQPVNKVFELYLLQNEKMMFKFVTEETKYIDKAGLPNVLRNCKGYHHFTIHSRTDGKESTWYFDHEMSTLLEEFGSEIDFLYLYGSFNITWLEILLPHFNKTPIVFAHGMSVYGVGGLVNLIDYMPRIKALSFNCIGTYNGYFEDNVRAVVNLCKHRETEKMQNLQLTVEGFIKAGLDEMMTDLANCFEGHGIVTILSSYHLDEEVHNMLTQSGYVPEGPTSSFVGFDLTDVKWFYLYFQNIKGVDFYIGFMQ